ncbi:MAG TPA: hypothetical protein PKJ08_00250 [Candidatus Cloacimonadota bacterium]|nr:hypothetical protein [Candidatus Cloacimonadota bacterium]
MKVYEVAYKGSDSCPKTQLFVERDFLQLLEYIQIRRWGLTVTKIEQVEAEVIVDDQ